MLSPCVGTCHIDPNLLVCVGCLRTRAQIASWTTMTEERRREIMDEIDLVRSIEDG